MNVPTAIQSGANKPSTGDELLVAPSLQRRRLQCYLALIVTDLVAIAGGYAAVAHIHVGDAGPSIAFELVQLAIPIFLTVGLFNNSYSREALRNGGTAFGERKRPFWRCPLRLSSSHS